MNNYDFPKVNKIQNKTGGTNILTYLLVLVLLVVIVLVLGYLLTGCYETKSFLEYIQNPFEICSAKEEEEIKYEERVIEDEEEVFHISDQIYTYEQAKKKCGAYGAKLATRNQLVNAYNKGANWCSYGWSEGQKAFYPTQFCSWAKLQEGPRRNRRNCGMPGVNGGYFADPNIRFGANCYGVKPEGKVVKEGPWRKCTVRDFCNRPENKDACRKLATDDITPFNSDEWSMYNN